MDASSASIPVITGAARETTTYHEQHPADEKESSFSVVGTVPKERAAKLDHIGHNENTASAVGDEYIFAKGGAFVIDGMQMKNVIFTNVHIIYHGSPLQMDNVFFVNCTFSVDRQPSGQSFADTFLKSGPSTTFAAA